MSRERQLPHPGARPPHPLHPLAGATPAGDGDYGRRSFNLASRLGFLLIRSLSSLLDLGLLLLLLLMSGFGIYAAYDARQVTQSAEGAKYEIYKPGEKDSLSFQELVRLNPDVLGWLTIYNTPVDYPLVQGPDNNKYLSMGADGSFSAPGSLFLDSRCERDFSDFNKIIHGHNMFGDVMFGCIGEFKEPDYFAEHRYGNLYVNGQNYGLEIIAYVEGDAYDTRIYHVFPTTASLPERQNYLEHLSELALQKRTFPTAEKADIVLLSTCAVSETNGRFLLIGSITKERFPQPLPQKQPKTEWRYRGVHSEEDFWIRLQSWPLWIWPLLLLLLLFLRWLYVRLNRRKKQKKERR